MNRIKYLAFAFTIGLIAISCGDDDSTAPVVNLTAPTAGSTYAVTDTILLMGLVTDDTKLETVILSSDLGADFNLSPLDSDTSHVVNVELTLDSLTTPGDYMLRVSATDEAGNAGEDNVLITVQ